MFRLLAGALALSCTLAVPNAFADPRHDFDRSAQRADDRPFRERPDAHRGEDRRSPGDDRMGRHGRDERDNARGPDRDHHEPDRGGHNQARGWGDDVRGHDGNDYRRDAGPRFVHPDVVVVRDYYAGWRPYPPGHVRPWRVGYLLPREVVYYELPPELIVRLAPPPRGHRHVRVDNDILTIAIATGLIIDAIEDFGRS